MTYSSLSKMHANKTGLLFFGGLYAVIAAVGLQNYIELFSVNFILGSVALLLSVHPGKSNHLSLRFAWPAILFAVMYLFIPAKTLLFASVGMSVFFMIETFSGRISFLPVAALILSSPIFTYVSSVFSFPIRIYLTAISSKMMQTVLPGIHAEGNMLINGQLEFSVDPACMGLHMLGASLLAGLILVAIFQKRQLREISLKGFLIMMVLLFLLNILSNLFRILCLVYFTIAPDSVMHQITGIGCFLIYVIFPSLYLARFWVTRFGKPVKDNREIFSPSAMGRPLFQNAFLVVTTAILAINGRNLTVNSLKPQEVMAVKDYTATLLSDHITKLQNGKSLIYIKPIAGFYSSDHQPMMCWGGSGYEFKKIQEKQLGGYTVYAAVLQKEKEVLYSAWWYDNGSAITTSQLEWRWNAFKENKSYALINITTATPEVLETEIKKLLSSKEFKSLLSRH